MTPQIAPGDIDFYGETQQPDVPVTSGAPIGPGPGPEALGAPAQSSLADTLRFVSQMPGADPYLLDLAHAAAILGY
jgi:hypothetical protein